MIYIKKIEIKNFRSISSLVIYCNHLTLLVGQNDAGKSNVLRALNLFFNGFTGYNEPFNFLIDHNSFNNPHKKAQEIIIRLHITLPKNYQRNNGHYIVWEKKWRKHGKVYDEYWGVRNTKTRRGNIAESKVELTGKSNVHSLLRNMHYIYTPAVKDSLYFEHLRAKIYEVISDVAAVSFRESSQSFESAIAEHLIDLTKGINQILGIDTRLALPRDLSHVFEKLDFLSGEHGVSLNQRGDGIKARHIPAMLKFITEQKTQARQKGQVPHNFIWAYEEPENNVEISKCFEMADEIWQYVNDNVASVFITTHSPVFYNLVKKNTLESNYTTLHSIYMDDPQEGTCCSRSTEFIDEKMGVIRLMSPYFEDLKNEHERVKRENEEKACEINKINTLLHHHNKPRIFVEGSTDKKIIERVLKIFSPDAVAGIVVECSSNSGGANYVKDMLISWHNAKKHGDNELRAFGIFDKDIAGKKAKSEVMKSIGDNHGKVVKAVSLPTPTHLHSLFQKKFRIPVALEYMFPEQVWEFLQEKDLLAVQDNMLDILPKNICEEIIQGSNTLEAYLDSLTSEKIYITYIPHKDKKMKITKKLLKMENQDFIEFKELIQEAVGFLLGEN